MLALTSLRYTGARNVPEQSCGPDHVEAGLVEALRAAGVDATPVEIVALPAAEDRRQTGRWHRMGLACGHLAGTVAAHLRAGRPVLGLLADCTGSLGMLGGVQSARGGAGLMWIDAHADFNTPETTLSGLLGGMPVAIAAGLCLHRMRREARLDPPLPARCIVMAGLRDVDPLERDLLDEHGVERVTLAGPELAAAVRRLAAATGAVYVHVDMDVLDPREIPGHPLAVPGGPGSAELSAWLRQACAVDGVVAFGVASTPPADRDAAGTARAAAHRLLAAAAGALGIAR